MRSCSSEATSVKERFAFKTHLFDTGKKQLLVIRYWWFVGHWRAWTVGKAAVSY